LGGLRHRKGTLTVEGVDEGKKSWDLRGSTREKMTVQRGKRKIGLRGQGKG